MSPLAPKPPLTFAARWAAMRNIWPFMQLVWQASPGLMLAALALRFVRAVIPVAALWTAKLIIDEVLRLQALPDPMALWWQSRLAACVGLEFGLAILSDLAGRLIGLVDTLLSDRLTLRTSVRLMDHAATLDLETFEDAGFQDRLERARRQSSGRMTLLGQVLGQLQDLVTVATLGAGLVIFNPWLILLVLVALVPAFLGEAHFNARSYALDFSRTGERRELDYLRQTAASVETAKEVKIFGLSPFLTARYQALSESFYAANRKIARARALWGGVFTGLGTLGYYAAYGWIILDTLQGRLTLGDLTFLSGSFLRLRGLLQGILNGFSSMASQALYLEDLFSFFQIAPRVTSPRAPRPLVLPLTRGFVFDKVGFRYPGAETWAVRDLSFTLAADETLALVGENGAGKTTIVKLLARLYDPVEGRITLDGHDLRDYDLADLRRVVGVIFQDFARYNMTAADNIAVGRIEDREDRARIQAAAAASLAEPVIARLAQGYDQMIGKRFRNGVELSGGEWQKLAIARAYMRDAHVLILDEPTAALDARAEFEVFQRFKDLSQGKTAILISHRFSSVRMADRILVLSGGKVEAQGSHAALLAEGGRYAELFELQASGYR